MISRRELLCAAGLGSIALSFPDRTALGQAAEWPHKEIHAICGFPPGTGADVFVRFYARKLQDAVGKTVLVENKTGAFGSIATEYVARSKPDGYTIFIAPGSSFLAAAPSLFKKLPFDPVNDFEHVTTLARQPFILVVSGDSPHKTVAELVAYLKQQGDRASYGALANTGIVCSELFKAQFGLTATEVKYKDAISTLQDLWSKNIAFTHIDPAGALPHIKAGKLRALATSAADPLPALPEIPSAKEAGIMNSNIIAWWSVHVSKGTPISIVQKLEKSFNEIAVAEASKAFLANFGSDPLPGNSQSLKELLIKDISAWREYVKIAKIEPYS